MKNKDPRPTRLDHFPNKKALISWLEARNLPICEGESGFANEANINTMLKATGGKTTN